MQQCLVINKNTLKILKKTMLIINEIIAEREVDSSGKPASGFIFSAACTLKHRNGGAVDVEVTLPKKESSDITRSISDAVNEYFDAQV